MPDNREIQRDYAKYCMKCSNEDLDAAHLLFNGEKYRIANGRAYYSIFHALRALFIFRVPESLGKWARAALRHPYCYTYDKAEF